MKRVLSIFLVVCMLASFMVFDVAAAPAKNKKEEPKWWQDFSLSGDAKLDKTKDTITLTSNKGNAPAEAWLTKSFSNDYYEVEFTMTVMKRAGNENISVRTGSKRCFMTPTTTSLNDYGGGKIPINAPLGSSNTYRLLWEDGKGELYFNDELAGNFTMHDNKMAKGFGFWIQGISGDTQMIIENVKIYEKEEETVVEPQATAKPYTPCYDYVMEFDDYSVVKGEEWNDSSNGVLKFQDGMLQINSLGQGGGYIRHWFGVPKNFTLTMRYKMDSIGDANRLVVMWPGKRVTINFHADRIEVNNIACKPMKVLGDWHIMTVKGYNDGDNVAVYVDDEIIFNGAGANDSADPRESQWHLNLNSNFSTTKEPCIAQIDWIRCVGESDEGKAQLELPMNNSSYLQGEKLTLKATVEEGSEVQTVDFLANGNVIATATAPDFTATVTDLQPGKYKIFTKTDTGKIGSMANVTVRAAVQGELYATPAAAGLKLQTSLFDRQNVVKEVAYFVDGISVGKSSAGPDFPVMVEEMIPSAHTLSVEFRDEDGRKAGVATLDYISDVDTEKGSANYMNELDYTVTGDSGTATYQFGNGVHQVKMIHSADKLVYLSDAGEQTFPLGTGKFKILTDGATADVYRNGQMAFSYYLPLSDEMGRSIQEDGMSITDVKTSVPEKKMTYLAARNLTEKSAVYYLNDLPYYHNTDFIAEKSDDVRVVVNDSYYRADVELKDGKFYVRKTDKDNSLPYLEQVADAVDGQAYYRIEVAAGMCRLYGNGRWLTTFRAEHAEGDQFVAVQVNQGDGIKYLTVHDNTDLFFYEDDFSGNGENDSLDFWMYKGTEPYTDTFNGLVVNALGKEEAITEVSAYVGNLDFTADVQVVKNKGGAYILFNHAVTNGYSRIGYNFEKKQYELVDRNENNYTTKKAVPGEFPVGEKVQLRLKVVDNPVDGKTAVLYVNGQEVLNCGKGVVEEFRGRFGFVVNDNVLYANKVSYRGDSYVNIGITQSINQQTTTDTIELEEGVLTLNGRRVTRDMGKTWTFESSVKNESSNLIQLRDKDGNLTGSIISVYREKISTSETGMAEYVYKVARSDDNGKSYQVIAQMQEEGNAQRIVMNNRVTQGPSGRIYFASAENDSEAAGAALIYYSDDGGYTWTPSETYISYEKTGFVIAETVAMEMGDGIVRCYSRTDLGQIVYFESYDYGKTFDLKPHYTPFMAAANCYNIEIDPYNPNHMYAAWGYDNSNVYSATVQSPRTRFAVAMSPDCGKTWHYVGTVHENTSYVNTMMNLSINVTKHALVVGQCYSSDKLATAPSGQPSRDIIIPKAKIKPLMDFEQVHMRWGWMSNVVSMSEGIRQDLLLASPESGTALIHGELLTDVVDGDRIDLSCAASYGGAKVKTAEDGAVFFKVGEKELPIPAESITEKDGRKYIKLDAVAQLFGLECTDYKGIKIYDRYGGWMESQGEIARAMVELFYPEAK